MANMAIEMAGYQFTDFAAVRFNVWDGDQECVGAWGLRGETVAT